VPNSWQVWVLTAIAFSRGIASDKYWAEKKIPQPASRLDISIRYLHGEFSLVALWDELKHSRRVSTLVLGPAKPKYRAQVYEKFCAVLTQLIKLRNYSSTWAVASGLNDFSIRRLGTTLSLVRASSKRELQEALRLIDSTGSYKAYREVLKRDCDLGSKAIPFL
jgi:hypothetical protein